MNSQIYHKQFGSIQICPFSHQHTRRGVRLNPPNSVNTTTDDGCSRINKTLIDQSQCKEISNAPSRKNPSQTHFPSTILAYIDLHTLILKWTPFHMHKKLTRTIRTHRTLDNLKQRPTRRWKESTWACNMTLIGIQEETETKLTSQCQQSMAQPIYTNVSTQRTNSLSGSPYSDLKHGNSIKLLTKPMGTTPKDSQNNPTLRKHQHLISKLILARFPSGQPYRTVPQNLRRDVLETPREEMADSIGQNNVTAETLGQSHRNPRQVTHQPFANMSNASSSHRKKRSYDRYSPFLFPNCPNPKQILWVEIPPVSFGNIAHPHGCNSNKLKQQLGITLISMSSTENLLTISLPITSSLGKDKLKMATRLLNEMKVHGTSFAIDACGKSGEDETSVKLESDIQAAGIKTDVAIYNSAISACAKGDPRKKTRTHSQTLTPRHLLGVQSNPTITHTHSPRHTDTPALTVTRRHLHTLNPQIPSPHNPLPPDSYPHNNATNVNAVYLASRNDYSSNPRSNHHIQIKPLDRNDRNLVQFGFFVDLKASGDSPYSQLQSGAIKSGKGSNLTKLFTIPSNTQPTILQTLETTKTNTQKRLLHILLPTFIASLLSILVSLLLHMPAGLAALTITIAGISYAPPIMNRVLSLLTCINQTTSLTILILTRILCLAACASLQLIHITTTGIRHCWTHQSQNKGKYITLSILTHLFHEWYYLPLPCSPPLHLHLITEFLSLLLGQTVITLYVLAPIALLFTCMYVICSALRSDKHRSLIILITVLACLAACSHGSSREIKTTNPRPLPLPLLHLIRPRTRPPSPTLLNPCSTHPGAHIPIPNPRLSQLQPLHNTQSTRTPTSRYVTTILQLTPLLLLQPAQLVLPALALLPLTKTTCSLIALSQLPTVLALSGADAELAAAGTLSTLVATAWAKYVARSHTAEVDIGPDTVFSVQGVQRTDDNKFCLQTMNIQGGITNAEKLIAIQDIVSKHTPDAIAISEAGKHCAAHDLKWLNKSMDDYSGSTEHAYLNAMQADFPYTIHSTHTTAEHERGGIVLLLHNKWLHKVVGKPTIDKNGRWINVDIRTPRGRTSLVAAYLPPSPQSSTPARQAWADLQEYVIKLHLKRNRTVYLLGDLNAALNNPLHRKNVGGDHTCQDRLLGNLIEHGGLIDTFPTCNPGVQYRTWSNHNTWSSPDHILISAHARQHATASQISNETVKLHGLDHNLLTTYIDVDGSGVIPKEDRSYINFDRKRAQEYADNLDKELESLPTDVPAEETAHTFFAKCIQVAKSMFSSSRSTPPKKTALVLKIKNDINAINIATFHTKEGTRIPSKIARRALFKDCDMSPDSLVALKIKARSELNNKSRKRAALARRLYINRRSDHFNNGRISKFLCSALSKYSTFRGVESIYNTLTGAVNSKPEEVKALATARISTTFYKQRIPEPAYVRFKNDEDAWRRMPAWYRKAFHRIKNDYVNPDLLHSMRPVTLDELRGALERLGRNKSGGPSQLTAEMLIFASPAAQAKYILPFLNTCIENKNTPMFTKLFNVWCIEKTKGVGPIMHPTNKLDVRPISLFEVSFKLMETVLATRINDAMTPKLHPAQHAFNALRSVVDAIVTYTLVMEDVKQSKKEIHISNNDCTQAYDAVPPWAMYAVYRFHGFPPDLIQMLINMDDNMRGRVLTAHGSGEEWTKTCGLGQGSVLAPLKWNLFLDPLLHLMDDTADPYIMGSGLSAVHIRILAFADDTTIFASSHKGYLERMNLAGKYFGIFGVNFSPTKTHYTYANTKGRHYTSAPITVRNPDGTTSTQASAVTSPHKPLRYLGAWLSPTLNWLPAKRKLRDEVTKLLTILRHKTMSSEEYKYTVRSVLHAKLRYYLAVVPLLDSELDDIDTRIAHIMKKRMNMASSCSSPLIFLPDSEYGAELPSIKDTRSTVNIEMAHSLLNDNRSLVGAIVRLRLSSLRDSLGWAQNPLATPHLIHKSNWNNHWCARIGIMLHRHTATIKDTRNTLNKPGKRYKDASLHTLFTSTAFASARATLKKHGLYWLGQITNTQGTNLIPRTQSGRHSNSTWWKLLQTKSTGSRNTLHHPISPTTSPIKRFTPTHNPGTIATTYTNDEDGEWKHYYYKITDSHIADDGRESCHVTQLHPCTSRLRTMHTTAPTATTRGRKRKLNSQEPKRVTRTTGTPYFKGDNNTIEFADALFPVTCTWVKATPHGRYLMDVGIIHDDCTVETACTQHTGITTQAELKTYADTILARYSPTGIYTPPLTQHNIDCMLCSNSDADKKCTSQECNNHIHARCTSSTEWKCPDCITDRLSVRPLHPDQVALLEQGALNRTIYSASDGSVTHAGTPGASSSFGLVIDPSYTNITRNGKITIRSGEESSLRVELEALIHTYRIMPSHIHTQHVVDNLTAIDIHDMLAASGLPSQRQLMKMAYHSTIVRLDKAMQTRGTFMDVQHTLSHLEHVKTADDDLSARRKALAKADKQADHGHAATHPIADESGTEAFALYIQDSLVEKGAKSPFALIQMTARRQLLYNRRMEGANHRIGNNPGWSTGGRSWPTFLRNFRHKLVTQRLPTAHNRAHRGDTENGSLVMPWCPHCLETGTCTQETHLHMLTCPSTPRRGLQLSRAINNDCRQIYQPQSLIDTLTPEQERMIMRESAISWDITPGWESHTTDKHGRESNISSGEPGRAFTHGTKLTAWAHNIVHHCRLHVPFERHSQYMSSAQATGSIDPHLLQGLADSISATTIHDIIPHNPFIPTQTLPISTPATGQLPTIINATGNNVDWKTITEPLTHRRPWILLTDESQADTLKKHLSTLPLITIPTDSIAVWGRSFWAGSAGLFHETNDTPINVYASTLVTPHQRTRILDTIYMRSTKGGKLSTNPTINPYKLSPETPSNIASLLHSADSPAKLQLLSGVITEQITKGWAGTVPTRLQQKLYRTLHKTIVSHQHSTWLKRNAAAHPVTPFYTPTDFGRKPAQKRQLLEEEEANPKNKRWIKQREVAMIRERMWEGTPIPAPKRKRSKAATPISDSPNQSSSESDTDEWPSPSKRSKSSHDTSDSEDTPADHQRHTSMTRLSPTTLTTIQSTRTRIDPIIPQTRHSTLPPTHVGQSRDTDTHPIKPHQHQEAGEAAVPAPTHIRTPFRRRNRQELETYIHTRSTSGTPRNITRKGRKGGGGSGRRRAGGEPDRQSSRRRAQPIQPATRTHNAYTGHPHSHTAHVASESTTLNPTASEREEDRGPYTGRLPATPEPEDPTHTSTLSHHIPALHALNTSLNTTPRGRRVTFNLDQIEEAHSQHK